MKLMISAMVARQNARLLFGRKSSERMIENMVFVPTVHLAEVYSREECIKFV